MAYAQAGPLCRYYAADAAAAAAMRAGVEAWRADLRAAVAPKVAAGLHWDEAGEVVAQHDLGDAGWPALRLFAFYAERAELELPDTVPVVLELDAAYRAAQDAKFAKSLYGQILACRCWLPGDFPVTLRAPLPNGELAEFGSLDVLYDQLRWLNGRTFDADAATMAGWQELPAMAGAELLTAARRGFAALWATANAGRAAGLPVIVHES